MTEQVPVKTDGVAFIRVKKHKLAGYLSELRRVDNFVPRCPVTDTTTHVTIVARGTDIPQYLIEVDYTDEEEKDI